MATISQTAFSSAFPWMKIFEFETKCYWNISLGSNWKFSGIGSGDKPLSEAMMVYFTDAYVRHSAPMS